MYIYSPVHNSQPFFPENKYRGKQSYLEPFVYGQEERVHFGVTERSNILIRYWCAIVFRNKIIMRYFLWFCCTFLQKYDTFWLSFNIYRNKNFPLLKIIFLKTAKLINNLKRSWMRKAVSSRTRWSWQKRSWVNNFTIRQSGRHIPLSNNLTFRQSINHIILSNNLTFRQSIKHIFLSNNLTFRLNGHISLSSNLNSDKKEDIFLCQTILYSDKVANIVFLSNNSNSD